MINSEKDVTINNDDIEYFNSNLQKIDELFEGLDNLILNIESERANLLLNAFSFISNIENTKTTIDSLNDQMTEVTKMSNLIKDPQKSSFSPIIEYCSANSSLYDNYKHMLIEEAELNKLQTSDINDINSAADYISNVLNSVNTFNETPEYICPVKFCKSLKMIQTFLNENESDIKNNSFEKLLESFKLKLLDSIDEHTVFAPFTLCGDFLVDQANSQLFAQYIKSLTPKYFDYIINKYYYCCKINQNGKIGNIKDFYEGKKHSETIKGFIEIDDQFRIYKSFYYYNKVLNAITENLIQLLIQYFERAHGINYKTFKGKSLDDLMEFETNYLTYMVENIIDNVQRENLKDFNKTYKYIKDINSEIIKSKLEKKFEELKNSISNNKPKNSDRYKQLVNLSDIIDVFNKLGGYNFDNYFDKILEYAEIEGSKKSKKMPFVNNFSIILDNQSFVENMIKEAFNNFISNFLIYDINVLRIQEKQNNITFNFVHGFLASFLENWNKYLKKYKSKDDDCIDTCLKYVYCLYTILIQFQITHNSYESIESKIYDNEEDIYSTIDAIDHNIENELIPAFKRTCYADLKKILKIFYELPKEKIRDKWVL